MVGAVEGAPWGQNPLGGRSSLTLKAELGDCQRCREATSQMTCQFLSTDR